MQHTPGPWENDRGTITAHHGQGGLVQVVAECQTYDETRNKLSGAERDRNARLIAAAPDLLAALKGALMYWDVDAENQVRAAIKKAEG